MIAIGKAPCDEGVILSGPASAPCARDVGRWILVTTILGSSMAFIDGTVVSVALPAIQNNLRATATDLQWVMESYSLMLSALLLLGGSLGDRYGRRRVFAIGIVIFAAASAWCGLARNIAELIVARGAQGAGGALLVPSSLALISSSFSDKDRGAAIGTWSGSTSITTAAGPVLGGWLVEHISWRAAFYINAPIAAAVLFLLFWRVPEGRNPVSRGRLDWMGASLATLSCFGVVYGLLQSPSLGWHHPLVTCAFGGGVLCFGLFLFTESRSKTPLVPLEMFRSRDFTGASVLTFLLYAALGAAFFFLPLNLIQVQGYSATAAGAAMLPMIILMFALSRWSGSLVARYGAKLPLVIGPLIAAAGFALFARPSIGGSYWGTFFPAFVLLGLGMAVSVAPLTTTVMGAVERRRAGTASGINNSIARVAGLLAIAVLGIVMLNVHVHGFQRRLADLPLTSETKQDLRSEANRLAAMHIPSGVQPAMRAAVERAIAESFVGGFRVVMLIASGLALASAMFSWALIGGRRREH
jgi:EmrB/QacA subfamily drug resistance transporter